MRVSAVQQQKGLSRLSYGLNEAKMFDLICPAAPPIVSHLPVKAGATLPRTRADKLKGEGKHMAQPL